MFRKRILIPRRELQVFMKPFHPFFLVGTLLLLSLVVYAQTSAPAVAGTTAPAARPDNAPANDPDPLLDAPPLPKTPITLIGGTVRNVDHVRNRIAVQPFGTGSSMKMFFDERTHFFRDGRETTQLAVQKGDRVYVDTQLDSGRVFARNIRVDSNAMPADASGQVIYYDPTRALLTIQDQLSSQPVSFRLDDHTVVKGPGGAAEARDLVPGSLINVRFSPPRANRGLAQEVSIIAVPGSVFTFAGKITHLDLSIGLLSVENATDNKRYDIFFQPQTPGITRQLTEGSDVTVEAVFEGNRYTARSVALNQARNE